MADIGAFSPDQARLLWQDYLARQQLPAQQTKHYPQRPTVYETNRIYAVILDAELAASTFLAPTSGLATVCRWSVADDEYTQTTQRLTVYNHSTANAAAVDTPGVAIWIDGHWWFFADCDAITGRPTPPWDV